MRATLVLIHSSGQYSTVNSTRRYASGLTLVEILVVVAIVATLAAITFAALAASRERSKVAVDVQQMRQIGQAAAIYMEQFDKQPLSLRQLLGARGVKSICRSPSDPFQEGMLKRFLYGMPFDTRDNVRNLPPCTYIGLGDGGFVDRTFREVASDTPGAGWLVNLART